VDGDPDLERDAVRVCECVKLVVHDGDADADVEALPLDEDDWLGDTDELDEWLGLRVDDRVAF